jgi:predicted phage tail protein
MPKKQFKGFGGSGGRKKSPPKPTETAISGRSVSNAAMLGIVSEGEIEGLVNGLQSVYFDETPVQNADGSLNFQDFGWDWRPGTQAQGRMPGFGDEVTSETSVATEVKNNLPITRTIANGNLDIIRIRLGVVLQEYPPDGGVLGLNVTFRIYLKQGAGAFYLAYEGNLGGRFATLTEFEYAFAVNNVGGTVTDFSVRVERVTPQDTDSTRYQRVLTWRSFTEVTETKLKYPNSAMFGFRFDAAQFQDTPQISLRLAGRKIQIPSNATPTGTRGLTYSGTWNGTFYTPSVAVADPAWILYDLITNTRYGLGRYINQSQIDKWALYEISQYCNEYVPNGYGGTEHRFQCHLLLEGKEEAYKVIQQFLSVFRGFSYWMNGAIAFVADKPGSPVAQFTQADVEDGMFSYTRTGLKTRNTIALVTWVNPDDFYRRSVETIDDPSGIAKYGVREIEMSAFACVSRGQARRAGYAALLTDRLEQETVSFRCRAYGAYTKPGDIIRVMDSKRADIRYGGLIAAATTTEITLDHEVEILSGETYTLTVMLADGTVQEKSVTNSPGLTTTLTLASALSSVPPPESNWILASTTVRPQLFRVLNRVPSSGGSEMFHEITAVEYNPSKYSQIENGWSLAPLPVRRNPPIVVSIPRNITLSYRAIDLFDLDAIWDFPLLDGERDPYIRGYTVELRKGDDGFWGDTRSESSPSSQFKNLSAGKYYVRVAAVDVNSRSSRWVISDPITLTKYNWVGTFTSRYASVFAMEF